MPRSVLNVCRYLKLKPRLRLLQTVWLCSSILLSFIVACCAEENAVRENGSEKLGERTTTRRVSVVSVCELSFIVVYFGANIWARLLFDCRLLVITFCRLILLFTMASLALFGRQNVFSIISAVRLYEYISI